MMAWLHFIRHGSHDLLGRKLAGRMSGVSLNEQGQAEARAVGVMLAREGVTRVLTSPLERACETADAIAFETGAAVTIDEALNELDFGDWTGASFEALAPDPAWRAWNERRCQSCPPRGETMRAAQARIVTGVHALRADDDARVALVSHSDMIRAYLYHALGASLDRIHAMTIDPGSRSLVRLDGDHAVIERVNETSGA